MSNHASYLDVVVLLAGVFPTLGFVAKRSVWDIPFIGAAAVGGPRQR